MKEATRYQWNWVIRQNQKWIEMIIKHGMALNKLTDEPTWTKKVRSIWP